MMNNKIKNAVNMLKEELSLIEPNPQLLRKIEIVLEVNDKLVDILYSRSKTTSHYLD